jgi:hypothetical protein
MVELLRTNDWVVLSWLTHALEEENIGAVVLDAHMSVLEGSIPAIQRRVMVAEGDLYRARRVLARAPGLAPDGGPQPR